MTTQTRAIENQYIMCLIQFNALKQVIELIPTNVLSQYISTNALKSTFFIIFSLPLCFIIILL